VAGFERGSRMRKRIIAPAEGPLARAGSLGHLGRLANHWVRFLTLCRLDRNDSRSRMGKRVQARGPVSRSGFNDVPPSPATAIS
jgi:hypothetical protein